MSQHNFPGTLEESTHNYCWPREQLSTIPSVWQSIAAFTLQQSLGHFINSAFSMIELLIGRQDSLQVQVSISRPLLRLHSLWHTVCAA